MLKVLYAQRIVLASLVIAGFALISANDDVQARPQFNKAFPAKYKTVAAAAKKAKCGVCHVGKKKKDRNDYGKALAKALGKKKEKDPKAIDAALTKAEAAKNAKGVTFGSLIKAGKLPGTKPKE